jgi:DNA-binding NarL/FixJ family response regulator
MTVARRIPVFVYAADPVSQVGVAGQLRGRPDIAVVDSADPDAAEVAVVVADEVDAETKTVARAIQRNGIPRVVFVVTKLDDAGLLAGVEAGGCGFLRRCDATPERLSDVVSGAAAGDGTIPPDLLGRLLGQLRDLQSNVLSPRGLTLAGLAEREIEVLKLVADGLDTGEIAEKLCYSERTVKNVLHHLTTRLQLRNRSHAVAYAMRNGLI